MSIRKSSIGFCVIYDFIGIERKIMDPTLTSELEKDLIVSFARGGKKVSGIVHWNGFDIVFNESLKVHRTRTQLFLMKFLWNGTFFVLHSFKQKNQAFNFVVFMEKCEKRVNEELQTARMIELRKSLNYIKETEWQYEPIEKLIGQA